MWTVLKFNKKNLNFLIKELKNKFGSNCFIYRPKLLVQKYKNNKLISKEIDLLGDYLFFFHTNLEDKNFLNILKFTKGLNYILTGFQEVQNDIGVFIKKCKKFEDQKGYISQNFFEINLNKKYKFITGPFVNEIFNIINLQKNKINIFLRKNKTTINSNQYLFSSI